MIVFEIAFEHYLYGPNCHLSEIRIIILDARFLISTCHHRIRCMALYTTELLFQVFSDEKLCYDALTQKITSIDDKFLLKKKNK